MKITISPNIDAADCAACANRRPWDSTISELEAKLRAHNVTWPHFMVMHGANKTCAGALASSGMQDIGLYVVAVNESGQEARHAEVFARKDQHYVGIASILKETAF